MAEKRRPLIDYNTFQQQMQVLLGEEWRDVEHKVDSTAQDFLLDESRYNSMLLYAELFDRYEFEMTKLQQMQRLFIQIRKRMERISNPTERTLPAVLSRYGVPISMHADKHGGFDHRVNAMDFARLMERLGVIQSSKKQDTKFIFEEYGIDGEASDEEEQKNNNQGPKEADANARHEDPATSKFQQPPGAALNQAAEAKRRAKVYFRIPEIEADFTYFEEVIIPELEEQVLIWIGRYLQNYGPQDERGD
jgi:hypothetical protein